MKENSDNNWVSFSDIMTGLMVIFLFISISYMLQIKKEQDETNKIYEDYIKSKEEIYTELNKEFSNDLSRWDAILGNDLSIKFLNPKVLFEPDKSMIKPSFQIILNEFLPKYFNVILQDKYRNRISEIRIEGHSDPEARTPKGYNDIKYRYIENLTLSQERATSVMRFLLFNKFYQELKNNEKDWLKFHLTSNGMSFGRILDKNKEYCYKTKAQCNLPFSRRVEFKIVTNSDDVINEWTKKQSK